MDAKQQKKTVRDEFAEKFISILESDKPLKWTQGWGSNGVSGPYNGQTGRRYNGINRLILMFQAMEKQWSDPRYYTFHQVSNMEGCKVRVGEKATAVEYWLVWDTKDKRSMTFAEYESLLKDDPTRKEEEFRIFAKTAYVFNAAQIEGLQLLPQQTHQEIEENQLAEEVIKTMSENMEVRLSYGGDEAYYSPGTDTITLPRKESFYSAGEYYGTALHELSHATGAPSRLDRPLVSVFADRDGYAIEELRAEIASTFVCAELDVDMPESVVKNHMAYVSSWLSQIKEDHNVLFSAIKDADKIADYMIDKGRVDILREKLEIQAQMPRQLEGVSYEIYQLRDTPENKALLFSDYAFASNFRLTESRYDKVYEAQAGHDDSTLDQIYYKFNVNHPKDFCGHSMSVSDVVVLKVDGKRTAWYCDSFGFREVPGFCKTPKQTEQRGRGR